MTFYAILVMVKEGDPYLFPYPIESNDMIKHHP